MTDIEALERLASGDESVVNLAARMNLHLAAAELRSQRRAVYRLEHARAGMTIELSTGEYIAVDDMLAILHEVLPDGPA